MGHKSASSVALLRNGQILIIRRASEPYRGYWTLPGGRANPGESAIDCARREIFEELGLRPESLTQVNILGRHYRLNFDLTVFRADLPPETPIPSKEIMDWRMAGVADLDNLKTTPGLENVFKEILSA